MKVPGQLLPFCWVGCCIKAPLRPSVLGHAGCSFCWAGLGCCCQLCCQVTCLKAEHALPSLLLSTNIYSVIVFTSQNLSLQLCSILLCGSISRDLLALC